MHDQSERRFEAGISSPDLVQSWKQIINKMILIEFKSFRYGI
jgi:hypothetical protein